MSSSQLPSGSKRKASATAVGPPEKQPKRPTPLEIKLDRLKKAAARLHPTWQKYDPNTFMEQMRYTREQINALTPSMVDEFITTGEAGTISRGLAGEVRGLLGVGTGSVGSQPLERTQSHQEMLHDMIAYAQRVQECLEGQF